MAQEPQAQTRPRKQRRPKSPTAVAFGKALQKAEEDLGWTPAQAAEALDLNPKTYAGYRSGQRKPNLRLLPKIAKVMKKSLNFFFGLPDPQAISHQARTLADIFDSIQDPMLREMIMEVARANLKIDQRHRAPGG